MRKHLSSLCVALCLLLLFAGTVLAEAGSSVSAGLTFTTTTEGGIATNNDSQNEYWAYYGLTVKSYLTEKSDGYERVEYNKGTGRIIIERYDRDFVMKNQQEITIGGTFGGFCSGETYNFLVEGFRNPKESDETEVLRVYKYDKAWNLVDTASVYGANTYIPFDAGSLRMIEAGGRLYIHTCHEMYAENGVHHQANMTFVFNTATLAREQQFYDVAWIKMGYVSHSFNQFLVSDGTNLYRMDHGDAYPRAFVVTKTPLDRITAVSANRDLMTFAGGLGDNATDAETGGFELCGSHLMMAGISVDQNKSRAYKQNVFISVTDTDLAADKTVWLTSYPEGSTVTVRVPQLVKVSKDRLLVMWQEVDSSDLSRRTMMALVSDTGEVIKDPVPTTAALSDCKPIRTSAGRVVWYTTKYSSPIFYEIDPTRLEDYRVVPGQYSIEDCKVTLDQDMFEFCRNYIKPRVKVTYGDYVLREDADYTITYRNNYNPGEGVVTLKGMNGFSGEQSRAFMITPIDITRDGFEFKVTPDRLVFNGDAQRPAQSQLYYQGQEYNWIGSVFNDMETHVGTYTVTGRGSEEYGYRGTITAQWTIEPKPIHSFRIALGEETFPYTGKPVTPEVKVYDGNVLVEPSYRAWTNGCWDDVPNYEVSYSNNVKEGAATVRVTGLNDYCGEIETTFEILAAEELVDRYVEDQKIPTATLKLTTAVLTSRKSDTDPSGTSFAPLRAYADKTARTAVNLKWSKVAGADGYIIYGAKCGKYNTMKRLKVVSKATLSYTRKALSKGTYYKFMVVAYKKVAGKTVPLQASKMVHVATNGGKYGSPTGVKITRIGSTTVPSARAVSTRTLSYSMKRGRTAQITASVIKGSLPIKRHRVLSYESSDPTIATVSKDGVIKGVKKGTCTIYVYAQNGISRSIKVTVS